MKNHNPAPNDDCDEFITTGLLDLRYNQGNDRGKTESAWLAQLSAKAFYAARRKNLIPRFAVKQRLQTRRHRVRN